MIEPIAADIMGSFRFCSFTKVAYDLSMASGVFFGQINMISRAKDLPAGKAQTRLIIFTPQTHNWSSLFQ